MWYDAEHFPSSWRLDPTEGPGRVRCRLQRYHLDVDEKYLMEDYRGKSECFVGSFVVHEVMFELIRKERASVNTLQVFSH